MGWPVSHCSPVQWVWGCTGDHPEHKVQVLCVGWAHLLDCQILWFGLVLVQRDLAARGLESSTAPGTWVQRRVKEGSTNARRISLASVAFWGFCAACLLSRSSLRAEELLGCTCDSTVSFVEPVFSALLSGCASLCSASPCIFHKGSGGWNPYPWYRASSPW